ncbi:M81 family metallopeptidase [Anaerorhabdus sp.]|uniref:M81 family metallopeptidase n=1 Tax=Anaerorhabdus sp. TaxID=1872524 RepID=UPI002FC89329
MKVLIGYFTTESNAHVPLKNNIKNYDLAFGDNVIRKSRVGEVFEKEGVELIPSIYASAGASGVILKETFAYIESMFIKYINENLDQLDGIFLHLHGASEVEGLGSGDHHILKEIRKIVGPYLPIAVVCDPHGNLSEEYCSNATIIRSYRESPHTDADDTKKLVAKMLCDLLKNRQNIKPEYIKLPLILGGEQSVSTDEPVKSINEYMDMIESDPRILSASWHVGYIRHDTEVAGCGVVVIPSEGKYQSYAKEKVQELADYVWNKRHEFHYTGLTMNPEEAIKTALEFNDKPVFITDSGDNVTSGATGWNTYILRQVLAVENLSKSVLFANICDPKTFRQLDDLKIGDETSICLGVDADEWSKSVNLDVTIISKGYLRGYLMHDHDAHFGDAVVVKVKDKPITISVASTRQTMAEMHQFKEVGLDFNDFDLTVIKQGYIFPEPKAAAKLAIMSLTMGSTPQDTASIPFKRIMRPMFPVDKI